MRAALAVALALLGASPALGFPTLTRHNGCTHIPQPYANLATHTTFKVDEDGRRLIALGPQGRVLWRRDPHAGLPPYRIDPACIVWLGPPSRWEIEGKHGSFIELEFDNTQSVLIEEQSGTATFVGQD